VEQRVFHDKLSLDATYFYNRFYDLIVSLGGNLAVLSAFQTDNLSNARAQGAELIGTLPAGALDVGDGILHLSRFGGPVAEWFHGSRADSVFSGSGADPAAREFRLVRLTVSRGRVSANVTGYFRGSDLDVDPTYGASAGLYPAAALWTWGST
jgi:hypothetical protein